jgi:hypothetical protein
MEEIKENVEIIEEVVDEVPLLKPKRKMKKFERTEKQKEAFAKTMQKRAENVELRKQAKKVEAAKLLLELEKEKQVESKPVQKKKVKPKPKIVLPKSDSELESEDESESEEEEIYYTKSRKSIKVPKKVYILKKDVIEDDSDDEPIKPVKPKFKSQQNKKSVIKVTENSNFKNHIQYKNYFCD